MTELSGMERAVSLGNLGRYACIVHEKAIFVSSV